MDCVAHLILPSDLHAQIVRHARNSWPKEAVGLLAGTCEGRVKLALPLPNVVVGDKAFLVDPLAQFRALRRLESEHLQLLAIYHSHPGGGIEPSQQDLEYAKRWSCAHLILAADLSERLPAQLKAFRCAKTGSIETIIETIEVPIVFV